MDDRPQGGVAAAGGRPGMRRPGNPFKVERDPEVKAWVVARIDGLTYEALAG